MNFVILGAGGIGYHLAESVARLLCYPPDTAKEIAEDATLWIIDGDVVEDHNLGRQHGAASVGKNKAEVMADNLSALFPTLTVRTVQHYLSDRLLVEHREWFQDGVTLFGCVDNKTTRCFVEDQLDKLDNFTWIDGGNDLDSGQSLLWIRKDGEDLCPAPTHRNPEMRQETAGDFFPDQPDCTQEWPSLPQLALANHGVAYAMLLIWYTQILTKTDGDPPRFNAQQVDVTRGSIVPQTQCSMFTTV
jgi:hypothetical protein